MKGDRDLVSIERSLGLRSVRGISRQSNKDSPPIKAILEGIKAIATAYVTKSNGEIRASHALQQDALDLLNQHGPDIWPGPEHERPPWLDEPSEHRFEGKYPRHLYFTNPTDRQILGERFYSLVVEKCCNYHDNQLQKHRRVSAKKQASHDESASVTPRREDSSWFADGSQVDGGDSDDVEMGGVDPPPPTNSWSAVNMQPTHVTAPPPALPSPMETPEVMPHGLPGVYEPKKESSPVTAVVARPKDIDGSSRVHGRSDTMPQLPKDFDYSFADYYIEDSRPDGDSQARRKRKRDLNEEYETTSKRGREDDDGEAETMNGHHSLLVKFKVNCNQLSQIVAKDPRPGSFSTAFQHRPPSPARTTTSSIADSSAYQGETGRTTRGRSKLDSLRTEQVIHVMQYRDKRGKWYEVDIDSRPDWATDERVITRTVPRGRPPSNYVNRREGSSRASSVAGSVTHASESRSSITVNNTRDESAQKTQEDTSQASKTEHTPPQPRDVSEPRAHRASEEATNEAEISQVSASPKEKDGDVEASSDEPKRFEPPTARSSAERVIGTASSSQVNTPERTERRQSSTKAPETVSVSEPESRSMPPPSHIPTHSPSSQASPERLRVVPLTTLPGPPPMLTPRLIHGENTHENVPQFNGSTFDGHLYRGPPHQPQPPGFRLHPHAPPHSHPHGHGVQHPPPQPHPQQPHLQQQQNQHQQHPYGYRVGPHEAPISDPRPFPPVYAQPGPGAPPRVEPPQQRYPAAANGPSRKKSLPLGVPLEIRPEVNKDHAKANGHTRVSTVSEPPAASGPPPEPPRWASVNVRDPSQQSQPPHVVFGARRDDKDATPAAQGMRNPHVGQGEFQQLAGRKPTREAPYAQPPQHAAAASNMQMTWNPTADSVLGELVHSPVGRMLQSQETPRNLLAVFKEIMLEEPQAQTDQHIFNVLAERRRQDQRYVRDAIRKHVDPSYAADVPAPMPNQAQHKPPLEEHRMAPPEQPRQPEQNGQRFVGPPASHVVGSPMPIRDRTESIAPRDAVAGAHFDGSPYHGHPHMDRHPPPAPLPRPPILPSQHQPKSEPPIERATPATPAPSAGASLEHVTVELNWNRSLGFSDYVPMRDCGTAKEFFDFIEAELPDELRGEGKKIKEIRVKALTDLPGGDRLPRIHRDEGRGSFALRQLIKKLKSQPAGSEPELEFFVVWEGIPVN